MAGRRGGEVPLNGASFRVVLFSEFGDRGPVASRGDQLVGVDVEAQAPTFMALHPDRDPGGAQDLADGRDAVVVITGHGGEPGTGLVGGDDCGGADLTVGLPPTRGRDPGGGEERFDVVPLCVVPAGAHSDGRPAACSAARTCGSSAGLRGPTGGRIVIPAAASRLRIVFRSAW